MVETADAIRFWSKVAKDLGGCWIWRGTIDHYGYGAIRIKGKTLKSHRVAFELANGSIPSGMTLDHLCRVRECVNPSHLEPVSIAANVMRGESVQAINARKVECKRGHALSGDNVLNYMNQRRCRTCQRERDSMRPSRSRMRFPAGHQAA